MVSCTCLTSGTMNTTRFKSSRGQMAVSWRELLLVWCSSWMLPIWHSSVTLQHGPSTCSLEIYQSTDRPHRTLVLVIQLHSFPLCVHDILLAHPAELLVLASRIDYTFHIRLLQKQEPGRCSHSLQTETRSCCLVNPPGWWLHQGILWWDGCHMLWRSKMLYLSSHLYILCWLSWEVVPFHLYLLCNILTFTCM